MPAPWIEAWKAWLSRVAERFVQPGEPGASNTAHRVPLPRRQGQPSEPDQRKRPPHRRGQRHG